MSDLDETNSSITSTLTIDSTSQQKPRFGGDIRQATVFGEERDNLLRAVELKLRRLNDAWYQGRTDEVSHNRAAHLILVSGSSGSGKSTLCRSLKETFEKRYNGHFFSGKIDQLQRQHQSNPLLSAVNEAARLAVSNDKSLQHRLQNEFSTDMDLILENIASLAPVLVPLPVCIETEEVPPTVRTEKDARLDEPKASDARNRFHRVYCRFFSVLCSNKHPVLLFLDDLQWGGSETFDLLTEVLLDDSIEGLVVVAACREVSQDHELCRYLRELDQEKGLVIQDVVLANLTLEEQRHHLSEILGVQETDDQLRNLSDMIYLCTGGNHFCIHQVICLLLDEGLLRRSECANDDGGQWCWDEDGIRTRLQCDEVQELVLARLQAQPSDSQDLLKVASCLGSVFDVQMIKAAMTQSWSDLDVLIHHAERMNFVFQRCAGSWSFAHDRLQQTAHSLIPPESKPHFHLRVGRRLLRHLPPEAVETNLLLIASQLRQGLDLIHKPDERLSLAGVFLRAGKKAAQMTQFEDASDMFETGLNLLPSDHWRSCYDLSVELYNGSAEAEYVRANFDKVDYLLNEVLTNAHTFSDQLRSYTTKIYSLGTRNRLGQAIETGRTVLQQLGEPIPGRVSMASFLVEYARTRLLFSRVSDRGFLTLPLMTDPEKLAAVRIMTLLTSYMYWTGGMSSAVISMRIVQLSINYGISHMAAVGLAFYGSMVCAIGSIDHGYRLGQLALRIVDRFNVREWKCRVIAIVASNIQTWKDRARGLQKQLETAAQVGFNSGDIEFALVAAALGVLIKAEVSDPLIETMSAWRNLLSQMKRHRQEAAMTLFLPCAQATANLLGQGHGNEPWILTGEFMQEEEAIRSRLVSTMRGFGLTYFIKINVAVIMGAYDVAADLLAILRKHMRVQEFLHPSFSAMYHFDVAATSLLCPGRPKYRQAQAALHRIKRIAKHAPHTHLDKVYLVEGEIEARKGRLKRASMKFQSAVAVSHYERFPLFEALGLERQSALMETAGMQEKSLEYLRKARDTHSEWGCVVKHNQLDAALSTKLARREYGEDLEE